MHIGSEEAIRTRRATRDGVRVVSRERAQPFSGIVC